MTQRFDDSMLSPLLFFLFALALATGLVVCLFGLNSYFLFYLSRIKRKDGSEDYQVLIEDWPFVTVQIATFNEKSVIGKTLDICLELDYPEDKMDIVVVDDSTDETIELLKEYEAKHRPRIKVFHRQNREGYKAGALNTALNHSKGDFLLILDADTSPHKSFLKEVIPHFLRDEKLGFVQGKIIYLNAESSWLTRSLALANDWYVTFSQPSLSKRNMFLSFTGHGGVFRRKAIEEAGGWRSDTITEDMDLSYRLQMNGWKATYVEKAESTEEIPPNYHAAIIRYSRHLKGPIQNLEKHGVKLLRKKGLSAGKKIEALIQMAYPLTYFFGLLCVFFTALVYLMVPNSFLNSFWLSPAGIFLSIFTLVTFPLVSLTLSPFLPVLLIVLISPAIIFFAMKNLKRYSTVSFGSMLGTFLIWNDNMLTGTKALLELLSGKKTMWVPTSRVGEKTNDPSKQAVIAEASVRIVMSLAVIAFAVLVALKNFTIHSLGIPLPACLWLFSAYLLLRDSG